MERIQYLSAEEKKRIAERITYKLTDKNFHLLKIASIISILTALILPVWTFYNKVPNTYLIGWITAMVVVHSTCIAVVYYYQYHHPPIAQIKPWQYLVRFFTFLSTATWGSMGVLISPTTAVDQNTLLFFLIIVASCVALGTSADYILSSISILCVLAPFIILQLHTGIVESSNLHLQLGAMLIFYIFFLNTFSYVSNRLMKNSEIEKESNESTLTKITKQVAHDIRSPLAALDTVMKDIISIPEDERVLFRNAINRIHDIANNLLSQYYKDSTLGDEESILENSPELISDLVASVFSEKRAQYKKIQAEITTHIDPSTYGCFANISASDFKRALSNLLNNAIESLENKSNGLIQIRLTTQLNQIMISIQDNGCGIPSNLLSRITAGEIISQKKHGHGLGLSYAMQHTKESWQGQFVIQSRVNEGTIIDIILPKVPAPKWFCSKLSITSKQKIVILDDDESIHHIWHKRLKEINADIQFIDYRYPEDLLPNIQNFLNKDIIFLVDYEFLGRNKTGLDVITEANIASQSYLVTSRYEEREIRNSCEQSNIQIIPKSFAPYIPIHFVETHEGFN